jgi:hypothetical protein
MPVTSFPAGEGFSQGLSALPIDAISVTASGSPRPAGSRTFFGCGVEFISKLQTLCRKAAQRDIDVPWKEIGELLKAVSPSECTNYFASCEYVIN